MPNALQHIEAMGHTIKSKTLACAILGYFVLENMGCLLVATKVTSEPMFFGGHLVNTVAESSWIKIPLSYPFPPNKTELKNFDTLSSFQVDGLHYYCETFDLTRPFPSPRPPSEYIKKKHSFVTLRVCIQFFLKVTHKSFVGTTGWQNLLQT